MSVFEFQTDEDSARFCSETVEEMTRSFRITREEAVGRINRQWNGKPILGLDMVYHETPAYWARRIYYEASVKCWLPDEELKVKPYP